MGAGLSLASGKVEGFDSDDSPTNSPLLSVLSLSGNIPTNVHRVSTASSSSLVIVPEMGCF